MKSQNEYYQQAIRINNGFKAQYVSQLVKYNQIKDRQINLIEAPCGTGKTTFVVDTVIKQAKNKERIVYLVDTAILEEALLKKYKEFLKPYGYINSNTVMWDEDKKLEHGFGCVVNEITHKDNRAFCMTYSKFANIVRYVEDEKFLDNIKFLCCDEAHHLVTYMGYEDVKREETKLYKALEKIIDFTNRGIFKTLLMTATPFNIVKLLKDEFNLYCENLVCANDLRGYLFNEQKVFSNIENFLKNFKKINLTSTQKYLIYIESITKSLKAQEIIKNNGFEVICLWSIHNPRRMDDQALFVRDYIIKYEEVPDEIDVVIINAAYETGYNIFDKVGNFRTVIVNSRKSDIITQVRGRIRHDIDVLITLDQSEQGLSQIDESSVEFSNVNLEKYLGIPLTTVEKEQLGLELNLKNKYGRPIKWTTIKKSLLGNGYIIEKRYPTINGKKTRAEVIIKPK